MGPAASEYYPWDYQVTDGLSYPMLVVFVLLSDTLVHKPRWIVAAYSIILIVFTMVLIYKAALGDPVYDTLFLYKAPTLDALAATVAANATANATAIVNSTRHTNSSSSLPAEVEWLVRSIPSITCYDAIESVYYNVLWLMLSGVVSLVRFPERFAFLTARPPRTSRGDEYALRQPRAAAVDGGARDEGAHGVALAARPNEPQALDHRHDRIDVGAPPQVARSGAPHRRNRHLNSSHSV